MKAWIRTCGAVVVVAVVACSSGGGGGGSSLGTLNGGIGQTCNTDSACPGDTQCNIDESDWIMHHQCTSYCDSSDECQAKFGPHTSCIGANLCVSDCLDDSDCPPKTRCGDFGWCEFTGPGSGVPKCTGSPTPCALLGASECGVSGCQWGTYCYGTPTESSCEGIFASLCEYTAGCSLSPQ